MRRTTRGEQRGGTAELARSGGARYREGRTTESGGQTGCREKA